MNTNKIGKVQLPHRIITLRFLLKTEPQSRIRDRRFDHVGHAQIIGNLSSFRKSIDSVVRLIYGMDITRRRQRDRMSRKNRKSSKSGKSAKKLIAIVAVCIIVVAVVLVISLSRHGSVGIFSDPNLEIAVREALNKPSGAISASELAGLANLTASDSGIRDLSGLQYCTNLTDLDLWHNQISDISPLGNLTNLTYLELGDNGISDISSLGNLTNLKYLSLQYNQVSDISPLANLTSLTELDLWHNQISDISPLGNLTSLTYLYLPLNQISDISPLTGLTNLTEILLYSNEIVDISPLVNNPGLGAGDSVSLGDNPLSSDSIDIYMDQLRVRGVTVNY
jgi:hypothetical protein